MSGSPGQICYLANAASVHTRKWATHFARLGYGVHVVSLHRPREELAGVRVHYVGERGSPGERRTVGWRYVWALPRTRMLLHRIQPGILHAQYATGYGLLGALTGFHPYVVSVWGSDVLDFPNRSPLHRALLRFNLRHADRICSTSRYMSAKAKEHTDKEPVLTPFGVDCDEFGPASKRPEGEITIGTVRSLEEGYGVEYLIQAFARILGRLPRCELKLMIVGDGSQRGRLEQVARRLDVGGLTQFVGWVPHREVPQYLQRLSIFVAASVHEESFGVAVLEASACGLPVVVSAVGGLPEVVEHQVTGLLVPPGDSVALADALEVLIEGRALRDRMGEAGRRFVLRRYEWRTTAKTMEDLYRILLEKHGG